MSSKGIFSCKNTIEIPKGSQQYPRQVGDILFDPLRDDSSFHVCNEKSSKQYYNFSRGLMYSGEKPALQHFIEKNYIYSKKNKNISGYITVRFLVNCKGSTGLFRVQSMDFFYRPLVLDNEFTDYLIDIIKKSDGWLPGVIDGEYFDYYQYLTFKVSDGKIKEILP
jgi:hypothetical protein